jgi:hypothetical protein
MLVVWKIQVFLGVMHVVGQVVPDISKKRGVFIYWVKQSKKNGNLALQQSEFEDLSYLWTGVPVP